MEPKAIEKLLRYTDIPFEQMNIIQNSNDIPQCPKTIQIRLIDRIITKAWAKIYLMQDKIVALKYCSDMICNFCKISNHLENSVVIRKTENVGKQTHFNIKSLINLRNALNHQKA